MEEHSVVKKRSVAELAGKFSCPISHMTDAEVNKPVRRRPPRSLQLPAGNDAGQGQDEKGAETVSTRKNRNSALIEKLQASLTLSPTGPPPFPKSPGVVKLPVASISPVSPSSPSSPPVTVTPKQEETPASFESPTDGTVLKSINKGRARHSIKRRPPSRRHRKSSADEGGEDVDKTASATLDQTTPNGHEGDVFEEHKTSPDAESLSSKEQIEQETKPTDSEKPDLEEKVEIVISEKKEAEEKEEKTEPKLKEEKSEDEMQLDNSTEETREELVTQPQTDEKEEEQKEDEVNR
ncbi:capZ-interacting protein-like isoform X1 [Sinocyclocheilus grahami]|uniref:CapZ-interacting protein-like n=1 Tax=Sinocyclocheilus grahami TaxID=75366 RepID=A0A672LWW9_SINGR|nr:PREDICTED: capZ-interacting protein-like isoform X1 [Sinocyclocheilus grahami]XP_016088774.1 PREDICTED: capZ-interacting protein-like isoform X1 [Sinocyclocheilus grahami]XP_016088775.1 PREDICTED: capZ-interacting protein-like isoform X1 [Sinocyclocheilus grahami]